MDSPVKFGEAINNYERFLGCIYLLVSIDTIMPNNFFLLEASWCQLLLKLETTERNMIGPGIALLAKENVGPSRRSSAGWMLENIGRLAIGVGRRHW